MMRKAFKYILGGVVGVIALYNSVYFRSLEEYQADSKEATFDAQSFVDDIWVNKLQQSYDSATEITLLINKLSLNSKETFEQKANALGIGNIGFFKVKGEGKVHQVNENNVILEVGDLLVEIETEFIFGNAIRDASGLIAINDFDQTSNFNRISELINDRVRSEVIPTFRSRLAVGETVNFKGAIELNKAHLNLKQLEVIPVHLQVIE